MVSFLLFPFALWTSCLKHPRESAPSLLSSPHLSQAVCGKLLPHLSFSHHIHSMSPLNPSTHFPPLCNLNYFLKMGVWLRRFYWSFSNGFILFFKIKIKSSSISSHLPSFSHYGPSIRWNIFDSSDSLLFHLHPSLSVTSEKSSPMHQTKVHAPAFLSHLQCYLIACLIIPWTKKSLSCLPPGLAFRPGKPLTSTRPYIYLFVVCLFI